MCTKQPINQSDVVQQNESFWIRVQSIERSRLFTETQSLEMSYLAERNILRFVKNVILVNFCDPGLRFGELELDVAKATRSFAPYRDKFWNMLQDHWKTTCESEAEVLLFGFTQCLMMSPHGTDIEFLMVCAFLTELVSYSFLKKKCYRVLHLTSACLLAVIDRHFYPHVKERFLAVRNLCEIINPYLDSGRLAWDIVEYYTVWKADQYTKQGNQIPVERFVLEKDEKKLFKLCVMEIDTSVEKSTTSSETPFVPERAVLSDIPSQELAKPRKAALGNVQRIFPETTDPSSSSAFCSAKDNSSSSATHTPWEDPTSKTWSTNQLSNLTAATHKSSEGYFSVSEMEISPGEYFSESETETSSEEYFSGSETEDSSYYTPAAIGKVNKLLVISMLRSIEDGFNLRDQDIPVSYDLYDLHDSSNGSLCLHCNTSCVKHLSILDRNLIAFWAGRYLSAI
ncbi:hypothetical protein CDAR_407411 [Caerostris darwini]|uniref:Uncharacterized protein n=1 Tax=Caerostris darwini TaxID=1538125 RepID=A0AAV4Q3J1_9ARAC|nr:hypothetical protein CDAR_407411 [Caerostris darwini]